MHNKQKHNHTIKITARYVDCSVSRWNFESRTFMGSIHSWSLAWLKWRYTIRTWIFKFCDKVTQYMLYTITTRIFKLILLLNLCWVWRQFHDSCLDGFVWTLLLQKFDPAVLFLNRPYFRTLTTSLSERTLTLGRQPVSRNVWWIRVNTRLDGILRSEKRLRYSSTAASALPLQNPYTMHVTIFNVGKHKRHFCNS